MKNLMFLLNSCNKIDIIFLFIVLGIAGVCVGIYFLIPVFNRKQYEEQRNNLHEREKAFYANRERKDEKDK